MNAVSGKVTPFALILQQLVEKLDLRYGWLLTLQRWAMNAQGPALYISEFTDEPVTRTEYEAIERKARAEMLPASDLAEVLAERHDEWAPEDMEGDDGTVTDDAWKRVVAGKKREIEALVAAGTLEGRRKKGRLSVRTGSFYDWLGESPPLVPDWGREYEVHPDEEADNVSWIIASNASISKGLTNSPAAPREDVTARAWLSPRAVVIIKGAAGRVPASCSFSTT